MNVARNSGVAMVKPARGPTIKPEVVVPSPVSVMVAALVNVMEPLMLPFTVIAILCRFSPLNCGQTTAPLISVGPLSVEHVTVIMVADAVPAKAKVAKMNISLVTERMVDPPIGAHRT